MADDRFDDYSRRGPRELAGMLIQLEDAADRPPSEVFLSSLRFLSPTERLAALEAVFSGAEARGWTHGSEPAPVSR